MGFFDDRLVVSVNNPPRHINGIVCDARNCVYHDGDSYCTAARISIGSVTACHSSETRCATFVMRGDITRFGG